MTKEELQEAATAIFNAEKTILAQVEEIVNTFQSDINAIADTMPTNPSLNTPVAQMVSRIKSSLTAQFTYEINNLKMQYGLIQAAPVGMPA